MKRIQEKVVGWLHDSVNVLPTTKLYTCKWFPWYISWDVCFTAICKADAGQKVVRAFPLRPQGPPQVKCELASTGELWFSGMSV